MYAVHKSINKNIQSNNASLVLFETKLTVIRITQPPQRDGAWSALFSNLSKSALDNYVVKRSEHPLLEEVA